ncbi:hypothetical protein D3C71_2236790 [compost metagenome]
MLGQVTHAFQLWESGQHLFLDAFFQGHINHGTAVTAATKLQDSKAFIGNFHQGNFTAVAGQLWVDLCL